jgi:hypothetical protein
LTGFDEACIQEEKGEKMVHRTASITINTETPAHSNTHLAHTHNGTSSELELIGTCRLRCLAAKKKVLLGKLNQEKALTWVANHLNSILSFLLYI